jgi:molybdate transport system substrate-binding protein
MMRWPPGPLHDKAAGSWTWRELLRAAFAASLLVSACAPEDGSVAGMTPASRGSTTGSQSLVVFAAASLTDAFQDVGRGFEAENPGVALTFNFASSQALRTQIEEGAAADVFASASLKEMEVLAAEGMLVGVAQTFATNLLTIVVPLDNPADIESPLDLARPGVKLVLAAEEVPVGGYARQAIDLLAGLYGASFSEAVSRNVVSNEDNVKQIVAKVQLGEADAGIVYETDAHGAASLITIPIPREQNVVAEYPIAVLAQTTNGNLAAAFVEYLHSPDGLDALKRWGFRPPL